MKITELQDRADAGLAIKPLREERHISQCELAALSGVRQATISELENGKRIANVKTLAKLYAALKDVK